MIAIQSDLALRFSPINARRRFKRILAGKEAGGVVANPDYQVEVFFPLENRWVLLRRAGERKCQECFERTVSANLASGTHVRPTETKIRLVEISTGRVLRSAPYFERPE